MWKGNWIFCYPTDKAVGEGSLKFSHTALQLGGNSFCCGSSNFAALPLLLVFFYFIGFYEFWEIVKIRSRHLDLSLIGISIFFKQIPCYFFLELLPLFCFIFLMKVFYQVGIGRRHIHSCHSEFFLNQHKMNNLKFSAFWKVFKTLF